MNDTQDQDVFFMRQAISEARLAFEQGEVPIGAVVVWKNQIVGRGHNLVETLGDPTAHAEMQAITSATSAISGKYLPQCRLYVTVEPCVMCAGACFWSQLGAVIYGTDDPKRGFSRLKIPVFHPRTEIRSGVLQDECRELMTHFFNTLR